MKITWSTPAYQDLADQLDYIAQRDPYAAYDMDLAIERAVAGLADHPERGRPDTVPGTRELVIPATPFILAYRIEHDHDGTGQIAVIRLLHGARRRDP